MYSMTGSYAQASGSYLVSSAIDHTRAEAEAQQLFQRLHQSACFNRLLATLTRRSTRLLELSSVEAQTCKHGRHTLGLHSVPISAIRGSENRCNDFDSCFRPLRAHDRQRWVGIAVATARGVALPPVELIQVGDTYFVRDGHHRISAARAQGQGFIDAIVTVWQVA